MEAARPEITDFHRRVFSEALFNRQIPLLDVLRRRVRVESREAHRGLAEHGRREVEAEERGDKVVALPRLREHVRYVVALVAPRVHVHRRVEDSVSRADHKAVFGQILRYAESRGEVQTPRIHQAFWKALLPADEGERSAVLEDEIAVGVANVAQRAHVFVPQTDFDGRRAPKLEAVLGEAVGVPLAKLHLRDAGLALL